MTKLIVVGNEVQLDIEEAALWYDHHSFGLGNSFIADLDRLFERIALGLKQFPKIEENVRRGILNRFPYGVYFIENPTDIVILAVLHLSRQPGLWKNRLRQYGDIDE